VVIIDNLVNSSEASLRRVAELSGKTAEFHNVDLVEEVAVEAVFANANIDAVIHFAGLKAVGEARTPQVLLQQHKPSSTTIGLEPAAANGKVASHRLDAAPRRATHACTGSAG